jgi:hypothetical protein
MGESWILGSSNKKKKKSKYKFKKRLFQSERGKNIQNFLSFKFAFQLEALDSGKCYRRRIRTKLDATIWECKRPF